MNDKITLTEYTNDNMYRMLELINDIEKKFDSDINPDLIHDLFKLQAIVAGRVLELQNEALSSIIFWIQEGNERKIQSYYILAKKLFNALKKELKEIDFRSTQEISIEA